MTQTKTLANDLTNNMSCPVPFTKMQGLGNDFVLIDAADLANTSLGQNVLTNWQTHSSTLAKAICNRRFGVGADGLILIRPPQEANCEIGWSYLNSDGTSSPMCGNGLRCLALWAWQNKRVNKKEFCVSTDKGPVVACVHSSKEIMTDLGPPILESTQIPVAGPARKSVLSEELVVDGHKLTITCLSMGNPHCVIFVDKESNEHWAPLAMLIQKHSFFPESVNVEFVHVLYPTCAHVFVVERGCGPTLACASGSAAVLVAGVLENRLNRSASIVLPGGQLSVSWSDADNHVRITGPAAITFQGSLDIASLLSKVDTP